MGEAELTSRLASVEARCKSNSHRLDNAERQFVATQPGHRYSYRINSTNVHFDINKVGR